MDPLLAKLKAEEARKKDLLDERARLTKSTETIPFDESTIRHELQVRMADARSLLNRQRSEARQILRKLIDQPFQFEAY